VLVITLTYKDTEGFPNFQALFDELGELNLHYEVKEWWSKDEVDGLRMLRWW
jgi:hypothetical protein